MRSLHRFLLLAGLAALLWAGCASTAPTATKGLTTVYVVRHAEKLDASDPESLLSPAGEARAQELAKTLGAAGVRKIYATTKARTQQTVAPLAAELDIEIIALLPDATEDLVGFILADDRGKVVLVAGHSNTVPAIVKGLSGIAVDGLSEEQFDRLYKVEIPAEGEKKVTLLRYGAPTP